MADVHTDTLDSAAGIDLTPYYQIFFEEVRENLDQMEQLLLDLTLAPTGTEELNGIFRCAHSIKGGAAAFGFLDVAEQTHQMESLLDRLRRHDLELTPSMVDVLLESADAARRMLARHQAGGVSEAINTTDLAKRICLLLAGAVPAATPAPALAMAAPVAAAPIAPGARSLVICVGPLEEPEQADAVKELFRDIAGLGTLASLPSDSADTRVFAVHTTAANEELRDLFGFYVDRRVVRIHDREAAPAASADPLAAVAEPGLAVADKTEKAAPSLLAATTIRVETQKIDQLMQLVAELFTTQALLAQNSQNIAPALQPPVFAGLAELRRQTRALQASVLSMRMVALSTVFSRFPRMLHDLASRLGKKVDLVTHGGSTTLDPGWAEKITDPLTHLVRNSCDHGIEMPQDRIAAGKPVQGTITLSAAQQGAFMVLEVRDDGSGLSRRKILRQARERGLIVSDAWGDAAVWQLIFAPGFSTADAVTDVSGRGVGMDVVQRNIAALNGTVDIESVAGLGMKVTLRLPLARATVGAMPVGPL